MPASFLEATSRRLAFLWRSFGSPRIAGDEIVVEAVRSALAGRGHGAFGGQASGTGKGTRKGARYTIILASSGLLIIAVLVAWLVYSGAGTGSTGDDNRAGVRGISTPVSAPTAFVGPVYLTEVTALGMAVAAARENGLVGTGFAHISRRIQFGEFARAIGETYRAERGLLVAPSDTEVWAFAFSGDVELKLDGGEVVKYDNLTVVIDALTGQVYRVEAFYGDYESEARAPVWLKPPTPTAGPPSDAG